VSAKNARRDVRILPDARAVSDAAREEIVRRAKIAIGEHDRFAIALAGGSTPKLLYASLAETDLDWSRIHLFFGDERCVEPDDEQSNYRMVRESLLSKIEIPPENVHRMHAELASVDEAIMVYEAELRAFFALVAARDLPRFDVVLLGMGPDGHTASLFPGTTALDEREHLVAAPWVPKFGTHRITLTASVINHAACVLFLVAGEDKASALKSVLEGSAQPSMFPAQMIRPTEGELVWLVDRAAAKLLKPST
jgi:6-phosphogluconolactonase